MPPHHPPIVHRRRYLDLADYVSIAEAVTGLGVETVAKVLNLDLDDAAEAAVWASAAGRWGQAEMAEWLHRCLHGRAR